MTRAFEPSPEVPHAARKLVAEALEDSGNDDDLLREDAKLLISELATNAVIHARSPVSIEVRCEPHGVRVAVRDFSAEPLRGDGVRREGRATPTDQARRGLGMGLHLVRSLASSWGVDRSANGKTVWAVLGPSR